MSVKNVFAQVKTSQSLEDVVDAVSLAMRRMGGRVDSRDAAVEVFDGTAGVTFAFMAKFHASIRVSKSKKKENVYDIDCQVRYSPNGIFWVCLISGFCLLLPWVGNVLYVFMDPAVSYQQALDRVQIELE